MNPSQRTIRIATAVALAVSTGCSDVLTLDVEAPGRIADGDLDTPEAIPGLVAGMSYDLSDGLNQSLQEIILAGGELAHSGSRDFGTYPQGGLQGVPEDWDFEYAELQQARWVAERNLARMAGVLASDAFESNANVARAYLLAGFANRILGEVQCASTIDGGPMVDHTEHFVRADTLFQRAGVIAANAGVDSLRVAALGGLATVRAWQAGPAGDWSDVVSLAEEANALNGGPDWSYGAVFSTTSGAVSNDLAFETIDRRELTIYTTMWENEDRDSPRVPWEVVTDAAGDTVRGQRGLFFFRQLKLQSEDDDIALAKGAEMLVLQAEAALRSGEIGIMADRINDLRAVYAEPALGQPGAPPVPGTLAEAWPLLRMERAATLWLEGRRLWDLRRWEERGGDAADPFAQGRDLCFPISEEEQRVNENL